MNKNKKTENIKTNKAINNMGNSNSIDALNAASNNSNNNANMTATNKTK